MFQKNLLFFTSIFSISVAAAPTPAAQQLQKTQNQLQTTNGKNAQNKLENNNGGQTLNNTSSPLGAQTQNNNQAPAIILNLNGFNSNHSDSNLQTHQNNNQETITTYNHNHSYTFKIQFPEFKLPTELFAFDKKLHSFWNYRWYTAAGTTTMLYVYFNFKIYTINKLLENPKSWHLWKEEIPLVRLALIDKIELYKQLKMDINKKNLGSLEIINEAFLLENFIKEIYKEKELIEFYLSIHKFSYFAFIAKIFTTNKSLEQITQYIARLDFIIDLFLEMQIYERNTIQKKAT